MRDGVPVDTIHFPDDPRPAWLVHPVLALGNFDGLHRGHQKIIDRVKETVPIWKKERGPSGEEWVGWQGQC